MNTKTMSTSALVTPTTLPNRGRSLTATTTILPGQLILSDSPLLIYPTSFPSPFCPHCLHPLSSSSKITPCPKCPSLFCSPLCLSHHPSSLCHSLSLIPLPQNPNPDLLHQSLFLIHAHSLSLSSPNSFSLLLSLYPGPHDHQEPLHHSLPKLFPPDLTMGLLARDRFNAFGIMEPFREGVVEERKVRAYGIYGIASLFNHDCLPNACRFDYVDTRGGTEIYVRAIHEIPAGREVCLSYFPVRWGYRERQRRLWEEYGFRCECDRCRVEMNWKEEEEEKEGDEEMMVEGEGEDDDFPHAYFFMRYVCDREECGGTLAPLPPSSAGVVSDVMECNVCGQLKREEDVGAVSDDGDMVDDDDDDDDDE